MLIQPTITYAHGNERHEEGVTTQEETTPTREQALQALQNGVTMMASTVNDENREEMFSSGPIMAAWHEHQMNITEAAEFLIENTTPLTDTKHKRIEGALNQLMTVLDDFHIATHDRDTDKAQAEVKKAQGSLKLIQAYMK